MSSLKVAIQQRLQLNRDKYEFIAIGCTEEQAVEIMAEAKKMAKGCGWTASEAARNIRNTMISCEGKARETLCDVLT